MEGGNILSYEDYSASAFSNSSLTSLTFDEEAGQISFNTEQGTFCNVIVPKELLDGAFTVLVDEKPVACILDWDETHVFVSFTYSQDIHSVGIKGEYKKRLMDCPEDVNGDGLINIKDLFMVAKRFGKSCP